MSDAHPPAKLLILIPWGRVGSNLLVMLLQDSLPCGAVEIANEPFLRIKDAQRQTAWLDAHFGGKAASVELVGCKSSVRATADLDRLARDIERLGLSLLRHRRANLVKVAVSVLRGRLLAAEAIGKEGRAKWGVAAGEAPPPPTPLDPAAFVKVLRNAVRADRALSEFAPDCPTYDLAFERLQRAPEGTARDVLDWLGLTGTREAHPRFAKMTPDNLAAAVPNLAELRTAAREAGLERYDRMFAT